MVMDDGNNNDDDRFAISLSKVIDSADIDKFSKAILEICYVNKTTMKLIYGLIRDEFSTNQVNTILRGNSLATKVETAFCRTPLLLPPSSSSPSIIYIDNIIITPITIIIIIISYDSLSVAYVDDSYHHDITIILS